MDSKALALLSLGVLSAACSGSSSSSKAGATDAAVVDGSSSDGGSSDAGYVLSCNDIPSKLDADGSALINGVTCLDFSSATLPSTGMFACNEEQGVYSGTSPCPSGYMGSCLATSLGITATARFYPPTTDAQAVTGCQANNGVYTPGD